jgi:hypothetical protein
VDAFYRQGATTLTIDALQKHALPPNLRARMESEARAGEFKWEQAKAQSEQELKRLLGNPAPIPGTAPSKPPAENTPQNVSGHAPVQRAAARDARRRSGTDSQDTQMHVFRGRPNRSQAFSGQWDAPGRMPRLCGDAFIGTSERSSPI